MTENATVYTASQAAILMKQEVTLTAGNMLFARREGKILVSGPGWTTRLSPDDFIGLYSHLSFIPRNSSPLIDEEKDRAYYAWRKEHQ